MGRACSPLTPVVVALAALLAACSGDSPPASQPPADVPTDTGSAPLDAPDATPPADTAPFDAADTSTDSGTVVTDVTDATDAADVTDATDAAPRCASDADCAGATGVCDPASGRCVACVAARDTCPASQHCDAATQTCVAGCRSDDGCAATDGGAAAGPRCDVATHTCVACVTDAHCALGQRCVGRACVPGCDATRGCPTGQACCAGGCVDTLTDIAHCGGCGTACAVANGAAACTAGACAVASCNAGFGDCDATATNGCETDTRATAAHCGTCGRACAVANGTAGCAAGACTVAACNAGYGDCDGMATNGCETDTRVTAAHCGGCGMACAVRANATASCAASRCEHACNEGAGDCDGNAANGCETDTRATAAHCGTCGRACAVANGTAGCAAGACTVAACNAGYGDCDGMATNGCETDIRASTAHCGGCGAACAAGAACVAGRCAPGVTVTTTRNLSTEPLAAGRTCAEAPSFAVAGLTATAATLAAAVPTGCLAPGDLVLLVSVQGAPGATANVGNHELLTVAAVDGATVTFRAPKARRYGAGSGDDTDVGTGAGQQRVVLQRVPVLGDVAVAAGGALTVDAWDGARGGVLALRAARLRIDGAVTVVGRGFRNGAFSVDDGSCSESLATERGESIEGPPVVTTAASAGASGGLGAASGISFNSNTPLQPSAGHATAGAPGQNPNGRVLGGPGGVYGVGDGARVTLGSGAGGNVTCRGGSFAPFLDTTRGSLAGGAVLLWADEITVGASGRIDASGADGSRTAASGGYVVLRGATLSLGAGLVRALGSLGVADNSTGRRTNRGGDGYVVVVYRDALTGTTSPDATARRAGDPFAAP